MDDRKNSRSHHSTAEGLKVKVKSSRATPTLVFTEDRKGSIYEINIHSSFDFHRNMEEADGLLAKETAKVSFANAATTSLTKESEENSKEGKAMGNLLMESDFAAFRHPRTEVKSIPQNAERIDTKVQTDLKFEGKGLEEKKTKIPFKRPEKENQSLMDSDNVKDSDKRKDSLSREESDGSFKQRMKNFIIENFVSKDDDTMKALFKNFCERMDNDQLHLHHHEHHHHYYFDNGTALNEKESEPLPTNPGFSEFRKINSAPGRKTSKERKSSAGKERNGDKQQVKPAYYYKCPEDSNLTFTKTSSGKMKPENKETLKVEKTCKIKGKKSSGSGTFGTSRSKFSSSAESILNKKSDFITTHIYSDTELAKCDSALMQLGELSEIGSNKSKELRKNVAEDYSSLVNSLRSFNHFMSPVVITDQKTTPKISYVKCECALKGSNSTAPAERNRSKSSGQGKARSNEGKTDGFENPKKETAFRVDLATKDDGHLGFTHIWHFMHFPTGNTDFFYSPFINIENRRVMILQSNNVAEALLHLHSLIKARNFYLPANVFKTSQPKDEIQNLLPFPGKKNKGKQQTPGQSQNEIWTVKLKTELTEIKKELKRIEEKHLQKRKSTSSLFNDNERRENSESSHKISVYSSKTFIFGAENVFIAHKNNPEQFESEIKSLFRKPKLFYKGLEMDV